MKTPFNTEQFFNVFEKYNLTVFPGQLLILLAGAVMLWLLLSGKPMKDKWIGSFLGILWIWAGLVYHIAFFTVINKVAYVFGGIFILQGILILIQTFRGRLNFSFSGSNWDYVAYFFLLFGLFIYPVISYFAAGNFANTIALGLPCPTTIYTFGFFMLAGTQFPKYLLIIPTLWAIVGLSAALNFGVYQDVMILVTAIFAVYALLGRKQGSDSVIEQ